VTTFVVWLSDPWVNRYVNDKKSSIIQCQLTDF